MIKISVGDVFGKWTVLNKAGSDKHKNILWNCVCSCESKTVRKVVASTLRRGVSLCCGCGAKEKTIARNIKARKHINTYSFTNGYCYIYTIYGEAIFVDEEDYNVISQYGWFIDNRGYVIASKGDEQISLHRLIMKFPKDEVVDHINRNKLDNRRKNLRACSINVNNRNRRLLDSNTSGHVGVSYDKSRNKWLAYLKVNNKFVNLGRYQSKEDAIKARLNGEKEYHNNVRYKEVTPDA